MRAILEIFFIALLFLFQSQTILDHFGAHKSDWDFFEATFYLPRPCKLLVAMPRARRPARRLRLLNGCAGCCLVGV